MAFLERLLRKEESLDIEEFINNLDKEEQIPIDADALVKPLGLNDEDDCKLAISEAKQGNIVLLNIESLAKRNPIKLKELIATIKASIISINGDIARISEDKVIVTPSRVKILKRRVAQ